MSCNNGGFSYDHKLHSSENFSSSVAQKILVAQLIDYLNNDSFLFCWRVSISFSRDMKEKMDNLASGCDGPILSLTLVFHKPKR